MIAVKQYGFIEHLATCNECAWSCGLSDVKYRSAKVRYMARMHVQTTGHAVVISSVKETKYEQAT